MLALGPETAGRGWQGGISNAISICCCAIAAAETGWGGNLATAVKKGVLIVAGGIGGVLVRLVERRMGGRNGIRRRNPGWANLAGICLHLDVFFLCLVWCVLGG